MEATFSTSGRNYDGEHRRLARFHVSFDILLEMLKIPENTVRIEYDENSNTFYRLEFDKDPIPEDAEVVSVGIPNDSREVVIIIESDYVEPHIPNTPVFRIDPTYKKSKVNDVAFLS